MTKPSRRDPRRSRERGLPAPDLLRICSATGAGSFSFFKCKTRVTDSLRGWGLGGPRARCYLTPRTSFSLSSHLPSLPREITQARLGGPHGKRYEQGLTCCKGGPEDPRVSSSSGSWAGCGRSVGHPEKSAAYPAGRAFLLRTTFSRRRPLGQTRSWALLTHHPQVRAEHTLLSPPDSI